MDKIGNPSAILLVEKNCAWQRIISTWSKHSFHKMKLTEFERWATKLGGGFKGFWFIISPNMEKWSISTSVLNTQSILHGNPNPEIPWSYLEVFMINKNQPKSMAESSLVVFCYLHLAISKNSCFVCFLCFFFGGGRWKPLFKHQKQTGCRWRKV